SPGGFPARAREAVRRVESSSRRARSAVGRHGTAARAGTPRELGARGRHPPDAQISWRGRGRPGGGDHGGARACGGGRAHPAARAGRVRRVPRFPPAARGVGGDRAGAGTRGSAASRGAGVRAAGVSLGGAAVSPSRDAGARAAGWFREPLLRGASRWLGPHSTKLPPVADTAVGAPTPKALSSSQTKVERLRHDEGPDSVVLSPNEIAALIGSGIDWSVRKSFDSLRVELLEGTLAVYCRIDTRVVPPDALGPLAGTLRPMEPLRIAGPLAIERPGVGRFTVAELSLRGFPFPGPLVKQL